MEETFHKMDSMFHICQQKKFYDPTANGIVMAIRIIPATIPAWYAEVSRRAERMNVVFNIPAKQNDEQ